MTSWPGSSTSADRRRRHGQIRRTARSRRRRASPRSPAPSWTGAGELADPQLRALQVGDQRERTAGALLRLANEPRALGVVRVRSVREVQPRRIHAGRDERVDTAAEDDAGPIVQTIFVRRPGFTGAG